MAKCLLDRGFSLTVHDLRPSALDELVARGARAAPNCRVLAETSDVVISMVRDIPQTDEVLFGVDGVWSGMPPGGIVVLSSTLSPAYCRHVYARGKERGIEVIDAPVSTPGGTVVDAEFGELTLMLGGDSEAIARCMPLFEALARHTFHLGEIGSGQTLKVINSILNLNIEVATNEALNLGLKAGLDLDTLIKVLNVSTGYNWMIQAWEYRLNLTRQMREMLAKYPSDKKPAQTLGVKDRQYAMELAKQVDADMPMARFTETLDTRQAYAAYYAAYAALVSNQAVSA
jgi:3-hydroxyisobutyrate dehydrogenase-like beta-hydroxyacid dehydrogenase